MSCPACGTELEIDWWQDKMEADFREDAGFALTTYAMPCCAVPSTLHALTYEWPQGFGRFGISVTNPSVADLDARQRNAIATIIGVPIRVILQRV